jgi:hypothetical protein
MNNLTNNEFSTNESSIKGDNINMNVDVKKKKGRPKKNVTEEINKVEIVQDKKKRGRKKKDQVVEEVKQKKKRGRKAAVKFFSSSIRKQIPLTTVLQDSNNFILHLDVKENQEHEDELFEMKDDIIGYEEGGDNDMIISDFLENDDSILSDLLDNDSDLRELYKDRIKSREKQDKIVVSKLESFHNNLSSNDNKTSDEIVETEQGDDNSSRGIGGFFEVLGKFINNKDWLHNTDVCCWWCCHKFDTVPIGMPVKYNHNEKKFRVKGIFCSFSCLMAYKCDKPKFTNDYLIKLLYNKITGELTLSSGILVAPPRESLKIFGGKLTIEEFRNMSNEKKILKMIEYPMFVSRDYIEEIDIKNVKTANAKLFNDIIDKSTSVQNLDEKRIEDAKSRLQSQIDKTTITMGNTIDKFIKIT